MAKFFRCWVIVDGSVPTSFRARDPEELIPTLKQLQRTQPSVTLKWFERGRLWDSPEAARAALLERRRAPNTRGKDWRPGGNHRDPRARYDIPRDEKRARFKKRLIAQKIRETRGGSPEDKPFRPKSDRPFPPRQDSGERFEDRRRNSPPKRDPRGAGASSGANRQRARPDGNRTDRPPAHGNRGRNDRNAGGRPSKPGGAGPRRTGPGRPPRRRNDK
jgi:hypothetical protein